MGKLVSDEMLEAFAVVGEYDEIADRLMQRYSGLLDEINFSVYTEESPDQAQLRKIIRQLQEYA